MQPWMFDFMSFLKTKTETKNRFKIKNVLHFSVELQGKFVCIQFKTHTHTQQSKVKNKKKKTETKHITSMLTANFDNNNDRNKNKEKKEQPNETIITITMIVWMKIIIAVLNDRIEDYKLKPKVFFLFFF